MQLESFVLNLLKDKLPALEVEIIDLLIKLLTELKTKVQEDAKA